ncbi:MAG: ABC transporter permease [Candidatus Bathyarchaeota archaeon]
MSFFADSWHVCWRELLHFVRSRVGMVSILLQPVIWLVLMGNMFQRVTYIPGFPAGSYIDWMAAGIIAMTVLFVGIYGGMSVLWDKRFGFMNKMLTTPISRSSIAFGKMSSSAVRSSFQASIILGVALILGAPMAAGVFGAVALILIAMLLCLAFAGISLTIGAMVKAHETFFAISNFLTMPLIFLSSALFPAEFMPSWLRAIVAYNPVTYAIDPMRALMITGWDWLVIFNGLAVVGIFTIFVGGLATFLFRRSIV